MRTLGRFGWAAGWSITAVVCLIIVVLAGGASHLMLGWVAVALCLAGINGLYEHYKRQLQRAWSSVLPGAAVVVGALVFSVLLIASIAVTMMAAADSAVPVWKVGLYAILAAWAAWTLYRVTEQW